MTIVLKLSLKNTLVPFFMEKHEKDGEAEESQETAEFLKAQDHGVWVSDILVQILQKHILSHYLSI